MPRSVRFVNTAAHFGACFAGEVKSAANGLPPLRPSGRMRKTIERLRFHPAGGAATSSAGARRTDWRQPAMPSMVDPFAVIDSRRPGHRPRLGSNRLPGECHDLVQTILRRIRGLWSRSGFAGRHTSHADAGRELVGHCRRWQHRESVRLELRLGNDLGHRSRYPHRQEHDQRARRCPASAVELGTEPALRRIRQHTRIHHRH